MATSLTAYVLIGFVGAAALADLRWRRIPNRLVLAGFVAALVIRAVDGPAEVGWGLVGTGLGVAILFPFYMIGGMGGGDVKLLGAVGAFLGPSRLLVALFVMALAGGLMAAVAVTARNAWRRTLANLHSFKLTFGPRTFTGWKQVDSEAFLTLRTEGVVTVPYGVAIAIGAVAGCLL